MRKNIFTFLVVGLMLPLMVYAQDISDNLILNNIGAYEISTPQAVFEGRPPIGGPRVNDNSGVLLGSGHFPDHPDKTYEVRYIGSNNNASPKVLITQHAGADSDRWLAHEVEDNYRDGDDEDGRLGLFSGAGVKIREINGNKIIYWGLGGGSYTWLNEQKVIEVKYTDLQRNKPEPIEVVQAYLAKFPSTITVTDAEFKSDAYNIKWIKDEMERRLWLCDKWNIQNQAGKVTPKDMIYSLSRSLEVFIHYRQKYYGVSADTELKALRSYKMDSDLSGLLTKLTQYRTWWNANKGKSISLP